MYQKARRRVLSSVDNLASQIQSEFNRSNISDIVRAITSPLSQMLDGRIQPKATATTVPSGSAVAYTPGDIVWDSAPTVRGSVAPGVAASYVRAGWICTAAGSPGTFQEIRWLTGS